jgi:flagellar basal-body rod modification protein FlgD
MINETTQTDPLAFLQPQQETKTQGNNDLGQADFLELMVAQLENQDPTEPLDANEFMSQLSQFSAVNGIQELNQSFESLAAALSADQTFKAASLVGRSVMSPGASAVLEPGGDVAGQVVLEESVTDLNIQVYDPSGALVRTLPMGGRPAGPVQFRWDGFADSGDPVLPGRYRLVAEAQINGEIHQVATEVRAQVDSDSLGANGGGVLLNLDNGTTVSMDSIQTIL